MTAAPALAPTWTRELVAERLAEAARTLRALPARGCFPASPRALWPQPPQEMRGDLPAWMNLPGRPTFAADLEHARQRAAEDRLHVRIVPSAADIARMDEALAWIQTLSADERRIVWARALGFSCRRIGRVVGLSKSRVQQLHAEALQTLVAALDNPHVAP